MCRKVMCNKCEKAGWAGCGMHVEAVLGDVPASERCSCESKSANEGGLLDRLFARR